MRCSQPHSGALLSAAAAGDAPRSHKSIRLGGDRPLKEARARCLSDDALAKLFTEIIVFLIAEQFGFRVDIYLRLSTFFTFARNILRNAATFVLHDEGEAVFFVGNKSPQSTRGKERERRMPRPPPLLCLPLGASAFHAAFRSSPAPNFAIKSIFQNFIIESRDHC